MRYEELSDPTGRTDRLTASAATVAVVAALAVVGLGTAAASAAGPARFWSLAVAILAALVAGGALGVMVRARSAAEFRCEFEARERDR